MKKSIFFKLLIVMGLILTVVTLLSTSVLAADDEDPWSNVEVVDTNNTNNTNTNGTNTTLDDNSPTNTNSDNSNSDISNIAGDTTNNSFYDDDDDDNVNKNTGNENDDNSAKDDLAYTGVGNTTKIVILVAIVGVIVAIYSYRKVSYYRSL